MEEMLSELTEPRSDRCCAEVTPEEPLLERLRDEAGAATDALETSLEDAAAIGSATNLPHSSKKAPSKSEERRRRGGRGSSCTCALISGVLQPYRHEATIAKHISPRK
tara:strand:- start:284 stop:607 length:324 start_codon:yes stop_codon:yes gene_type:complete